MASVPVLARRSAKRQSRAKPANGDNNKLLPQDRAAHEWYRFVLSFPPHLVRDYAGKFGLTGRQLVLDPFCGTGTTLVECKKLGIPSVGVEAGPMAHFASTVKTRWDIDPQGLAEHARSVAGAARETLQSHGLDDDDSLPLFKKSSVAGAPVLRRLSADSHKLLLRDSMDPVQLHKTLVLLDHIREGREGRYRDHELLALAKALVTSISNLHFGPEVGVRVKKVCSPVVASWLKCVLEIVDDLRELEPLKKVQAEVRCGDSRDLHKILRPCSIDAVITSPPYPNEKDYTRTTRLESVLLGFIRSKNDLRAFKKSLLCSNTRNVYKGDDDDRWIADFPEIQEIAREIEARRVALGKTSGFERQYNRVAKLYFGGMARHLAGLRAVLRPRASLAYVVGDQASYLRVMIRTGQLLARIAEHLGYQVQSVDLFRTRLATATGEWLREEVVVLKWPGGC